MATVARLASRDGCYSSAGEDSEECESKERYVIGASRAWLASLGYRMWPVSSLSVLIVDLDHLT